MQQLVIITLSLWKNLILGIITGLDAKLSNGPLCSRQTVSGKTVMHTLLLIKKCPTVKASVVKNGRKISLPLFSPNGDDDHLPVKW